MMRIVRNDPVLATHRMVVIDKQSGAEILHCVAADDDVGEYVTLVCGTDILPVRDQAGQYIEKRGFGDIKIILIEREDVVLDDYWEHFVPY